MNPTVILSGFYATVVPDATIGISHISLYMALYQLWRLNNWATPILIKRQEVMRLAKIGSCATYHRCLKQLIEIGCINYEPSSNPAQKSKVYLVQSGQPKNESGDAETQPLKRPGRL
jgi:hypothetical protein